MESDPIERQLPWLTPWFTASSYSGKDFNNQDYVIADAISSDWLTTPKVDLFDSLGDKYGRDKVAGVIDKIVAAHIKPEWEATARTCLVTALMILSACSGNLFQTRDLMSLFRSNLMRCKSTAHAARTRNWGGKSMAATGCTTWFAAVTRTPRLDSTHVSVSTAHKP